MALPPPSPGLDLTESKVPQIYGTLISMFTLATVAVALRFFARHLKGNPIVSFIFEYGESRNENV